MSQHRADGGVRSPTPWSLIQHFQKYHKSVFKTNYRLLKVESIAECSKGSILQYFDLH